MEPWEKVSLSDMLTELQTRIAMAEEKGARIKEPGAFLYFWDQADVVLHHIKRRIAKLRKLNLEQRGHEQGLRECQRLAKKLFNPKLKGE